MLNYSLLGIYTQRGESTENNVSSLVLRNGCMGCGACAVVCPVNAIEIVRSHTYLAKVNNSKCNSCQLCLTVCPVIRSSKSMMKDVSTLESLIGSYRKVLLAKSTSRQMKDRGSSGGVVTTLLVSAYEQKIIDGALLVVTDNCAPPQYFLATAKNQIVRGLGSKYLIFPYSKGLKLFSQMNGKYAVVGLPCQIKALRKIMNLDRAMKDKIVLLVGLFCGRGIDLNSSNFMMKILGKRGNIIGSVREGNSQSSGILRVFLSRGQEIREYSIPFETWAKYTLPSFFFMPAACLYCTDHTAEEADISFGDAWHIKNDDNKSLMIVRTKGGEAVLDKAVESGSLKTKEISPFLAVYSQSSQLYFHKLCAGTLNRSFPSCLSSLRRFAVICTIAIYASNTFYRLLKAKPQAIPPSLARLAGLIISFLRKVGAKKLLLEVIAKRK